MKHEFRKDIIRKMPEYWTFISEFVNSFLVIISGLFILFSSTIAFIGAGESTQERIREIGMFFERFLVFFSLGVVLSILISGIAFLCIFIRQTKNYNILLQVFKSSIIFHFWCVLIGCLLFCIFTFT